MLWYFCNHLVVLSMCVCVCVGGGGGSSFLLTSNLPKMANEHGFI